MIPAPRHVSSTAGSGEWEGVLTVAVDHALDGVWPLLGDLLTRRLGLRLVPAALTGPAGPPADVVVEVGELVEVGEPADPSHAVDDHAVAGSYRLTTTAAEAGRARVVIGAPDLAGAIAAIHTLAQLVGPDAFRATPIRTDPVVVPLVSITDAPRFAHRGVLLDVARHFLPKDQVMRFIELAAAHQLNVLHLHLTDDQGWRFESRQFPRLVEVAAWREESQAGPSGFAGFDARPHGGFYTQDDLREIVAFARTRGVTVIPEIDLPGHSQAAIAAYPELGAEPQDLPVWTEWGLNPHVLDTSEHVVEFMAAVLDELVEVFDAPVICLGGDEVDTAQWEGNARIRAQAAELGFDGVAELLPWFVSRLASHLRARGRRTSVWDEVSGASVPRDVVVNAWRGGGAGAADALAQGHDVVLCPEDTLYLDHRAGDSPDEPAPVGGVHTIADVYAYEPVSESVRAVSARAGAGSVLGVQAQVWREHLTDARRTDFAAYPRLCAFAEVAWSAAEARDWASFSERLDAHLELLDAAGVEYRPLDGPRPWHRWPRWGMAGS